MENRNAQESERHRQPQQQQQQYPSHDTEPMKPIFGYQNPLQPQQGTSSSGDGRGGVMSGVSTTTTGTLDLSQLTRAQLLALQQQQLQLNSLLHTVGPQHLQLFGATAATTATTCSGNPFAPQQLNMPALQMTPNFMSPPTAVPTIPPSLLLSTPPSPPVYNGVNPEYPGLRVVHRDPPLFAVDHFLTVEECQFLVQAAHDSFGPAPVVGKGAGELSQARTSSTCYLARQDLPNLLRKIRRLTGTPIEHCELPQVGRYYATQQYLQHYDAFDLETVDGQRFAANGGQRTITVLIYLNSVAQGGQTRFPLLNLEVQPQQGMALVFFPATIDGRLDKMALHAALPAVDTKYVSQVWIRQAPYHGLPSKRLPMTMGPPLMPSECGGAMPLNDNVQQQQGYQALQQQFQQ